MKKMKRSTWPRNVMHHQNSEQLVWWRRYICKKKGEKSFPSLWRERNKLSKVNMQSVKKWERVYRHHGYYWGSEILEKKCEPQVLFFRIHITFFISQIETAPITWFWSQKIRYQLWGCHLISMWDWITIHRCRLNKHGSRDHCLLEFGGYWCRIVQGSGNKYLFCQVIQHFHQIPFDATPKWQQKLHM